MIRFGYFPDFSDPTVLFWGQADDLARFAAFLRRVVSSTRGEVHLADETLFEPADRASLVIVPSSDGLGVRRVESEPPEAAFRWLLSRELAERFSDLIEAVASAPGPAHQYLDSPDGDDAVVVVSKGEYDGAFGTV